MGWPTSLYGTTGSGRPLNANLGPRRLLTRGHGARERAYSPSQTGVNALTARPRCLH
jgi:hypothetical protein